MLILLSWNEQTYLQTFQDIEFISIYLQKQSVSFVIILKYYALKIIFKQRNINAEQHAISEGKTFNCQPF